MKNQFRLIFKGELKSLKVRMKEKERERERKNRSCGRQMFVSYFKTTIKNFSNPWAFPLVYPIGRSFITKCLFKDLTHSCINPYTIRLCFIEQIIFYFTKMHIFLFSNFILFKLKFKNIFFLLNF